MQDETPAGLPPVEKSSLINGRLYRRAQPAEPFFPAAILPIAGLLILLMTSLTMIAFNVVQAGARESAVRALAASGESWAEVSVSGQWVRLEGSPPSAEAASRAIDAVRAARRQTWLGDVTPVTRVSSGFTASTRQDLPQPHANTLNVVGEARPEIPAAGFEFRRTGTRLTLAGGVPDKATYDSVMGAARSLQAVNAVSHIADQLEILGAAAPAGFDALAAGSVAALEKCETGVAELTAAGYRLHCETIDEPEEGFARRAAGMVPAGIEASIEVVSTEVMETCQAELSSLLEAARIEFDSASATIKLASSPVLDLTAHAAADCPGKLRVTGHTDSTGSLALNQALSLERALAVRAALVHRGVPAERLIAEGRGPNEPVADNATAEGRARNRRIELRIIRAVE